MSLVIYLAGHGEWEPDDGFVELPKGCSMSFYTHHAKTLLTNAAYQIVAGTFPGQPESTISEYKMVPNMTQIGFVAAENAIRQGFNTNYAANTDPNTRLLLLQAGESIRLSDLFTALSMQLNQLAVAHGGVEFKWCCCRYVNMKGEVRGRSGFNATEDLVNNRYIFRDRVANTILGYHAK